MSKHPPLLPRPTNDATLRHEPVAPRKRKGKNISLACEICRKRKIKCDGQRPTCSACARSGATSCDYRTKGQSSSHESNQTIQRLQMLPKNDAIKLLHAIREGGSSSIPPATSAERDEPTPVPCPSEQQLLKGLLPSTQNSLEFELTIRHPIAYPTLYPVQLNSMSLEALLKPCRFSRLSSPSPPSEIIPSHSSYHQRPLVDDRLSHVKFDFWTKVPIDNALAAHIISLYLELDYPVMPLFSADLFLDNLVHQRFEFCCRFLVNALLCFGCEIYTSIAPQVTALTVAFYREARRQWEEEIPHNATITAIAGANLLAMAVITYGMDGLANQYLTEGMNMIKQLDLFGSQTVHTPPESLPDEIKDKWSEATSYTAWGVFNWACVYGLHYQAVWIEAPPELPMPPDVGVDVPALIDVQTFRARCELSVIMNDVLWKYYHDHGLRSSSERASLEFAEEVYHRFLRWAASLPLGLARSDKSNHAIFLLHIYYHAIITDLFRPFLQTSMRNVRLESFTTPKATARAAYSASVNQLKRLLLIYRLKFKSAMLSVLWQTAVIYVANGMIREARTANSTEWRFYFHLCVASLKDLTYSFCVFEVIAHAILGMALQHDVLGIEEVNRIVAELHKLTQHHIPIHDPMSAADRATWIIDLDLGATDPGAAQGSTLAEQLQDLMLMEEFTTGEWSSKANERV